MTENEQNHICEALLTYASATEILMTEYLRMQHLRLAGETKQVFNNMSHAIRTAKYYYSRFMNLVAEVQYEDHKDISIIDNMNDDANTFIRLYMYILNATANGYPLENIEKALRELTEKQEDPTIEVSQKVIDKFILR